MTSDECRAIRARLGLTQEELADLLGVSQVTVARWETGARAISRTTEIAILAQRGRKRSKRKSE